MANQVDDIVIDIESSVDGADAGLEKLASVLDTLKKAVEGIDAKKLSDLKDTINSFSITTNTLDGIRKFSDAINGLSRVANILSFKRPTAEAEVFTSKAKSYAQDLGKSFGLNKKDIGELADDFVELAQVVNGGITSGNSYGEDLTGIFDKIQMFVWQSKNVVNDFGKDYQSVVEKIRSISRGSIKLDFGVEEIGDDFKSLKKVLGSGFTEKNNPFAQQTGFDAWLKSLDTSEIQQINSVIEAQGGIVGDTASAFRALAYMVETYNNATKKGAVREDTFNSNIESIGEVTSEAINSFSQMTAEMGKVDFKNVSNGSQTFYDTFDKVVDILNKFEIDPNIGTNLEAMAKGFNSIVKSVKKLEGVNSEKLQEIADVISRVGAGLGNLGSNNKISIRIDAEGIKKTEGDLQEVKKQIDETFEDFKRKIQDVGKGFKSINTGDALRKEIEGLERQLDKLLAKEAKLQAVGNVNQNSSSWKSLQYDITETRNKLESLNAQWKEEQDYVEILKEAMEELANEMKELSKTEGFGNVQFSGDAASKQIQDLIAKQQKLSDLVNGMDSGKYTFNVANYQQAKAELENINKQIERMKATPFDKFKSALPIVASALNTVSRAASTASGYFKKLAKTYSTLLKTFSIPIKFAGKQLMNEVNKVGDAFARMRKKSTDNLKKMSDFWKRTMRTFTFMLVRKAITGILNELDTAKQSLALWSDYVGTLFNKSVSNIKSDCDWIARAIVAAFEPLVNAVAPIIDFIAEKITNFLAKVGEFFAALTGQSYYVKAKKNLIDYAKSLDKSKKSAKSTLQSFDEINNITTQKNSDADSPLNTFKDDWEKKDVSDKMKGLADKIKQIAADLWYPIGKAWDAMKDYVIGGWKYMSSEIASLAKDMWDDFITVWKEDATVDIFKNIFGIVGDIEYTIGNLVHNFHEAWNDADTGLKIFRNIRDVIGILVQHARNVTSYMVEWSRGIDFNPLLKSIEQLTFSLKRVADFIGGVFEDVMKEGVLKFIKWLIEVGIPDINKAFASIFDRIDFDKLRANILPVIKSIERLFENVIGGVTLAVKNLGEYFADFLNSDDFAKMATNFSKFLKVFTKERIATVLEAIGKAFMNIAIAIGKILTSDAVVALFEVIGREIEKMGSDKLAARIESLFKILAVGFVNVSILGAIATGIAKIASALAGLVGLISGGIKIYEFLKGLGLIATVAKGAGAAKSVSFFTQIGDAISKLGVVLKGAGSSVLNLFKQFGLGISTVAKEVGGALATIGKSMVAPISEMAATVSPMGTILIGVLGGVVAAVAGWNFGQKIYEALNCEKIEMSFDEQMDTIIGSFFDGTAKDALAMWAEDLRNLALDVANAQGDILVGLLQKEAEGMEVRIKVAMQLLNMLLDFIGGIKDGIKAKIDEGITAIKETLTALWDGFLVPFFGLDKWLTLAENIRLAIKTKWDETVGQWLLDLQTWWEQTASMFLLEKWNALLSVIPTAFKTAFKAAANGAISMMNKVLEGIEKMVNGGLTGLNKIVEWAKKMGLEVNVEAIPTLKLPRIPTFAMGGMPEDGLFMANHNELVGQFSNGRTAVANNSQIVEGIASGVSQANQEQYSLMNTMIDLLGVIAEKDLTIGDDAIYSSYRRGQARYAKRYGV